MLGAFIKSTIVEILSVCQTHNNVPYRQRSTIVEILSVCQTERVMDFPIESTIVEILSVCRDINKSCV